jgi:hypothetical protein
MQIETFIFNYIKIAGPKRACLSPKEKRLLANLEKA